MKKLKQNKINRMNKIAKVKKKIMIKIMIINQLLIQPKTEKNIQNILNKEDQNQFKNRINKLKNI